MQQYIGADLLIAYLGMQGVERAGRDQAGVAGEQGLGFCFQGNGEAAAGDHQELQFLVAVQGHFPAGSPLEIIDGSEGERGMGQDMAWQVQRRGLLHAAFSPSFGFCSYYSIFSAVVYMQFSQISYEFCAS